MARPKILFVYYSPVAFVVRDMEILKKHFEVESLQWTGKRDYLKLFNAVRRADITFSWFAGTHAFHMVFLSRLLRRKSIVIVGGYEVVDMPEIDYGGLTQPRFKKQLKYIVNKADGLISISKSNLGELKGFADVDSTLIYNGIDTELFALDGTKAEAKERLAPELKGLKEPATRPLAITVGGVKRSNLKRKGMDGFVKAAKHLPDVNFVLIGKAQDDAMDEMKGYATDNVHFTGFVGDDDLVEYYRAADIYVQASGHEGFGIAMGEAMACGCVPVVSRRGALPEVVDDTGIFVEFDDPKSIAEGIKKAVTSGLGPKASERMNTEFPLSKREERLVGYINEFWSKVK